MRRHQSERRARQPESPPQQLGVAAIAGQRGQGWKAILAACCGPGLSVGSQRAEVRPNTAFTACAGACGGWIRVRADLEKSSFDKAKRR